MAEPEPLLGRTLSHYRILERLSGGGTGVVYKAEDTRLHRFVALKFPPDDVLRDHRRWPALRERRRRLRPLNHPNICTIYVVGEEGGKTFIVMELLEGYTLKHLIETKSLPLVQVVELSIEIADALDAGA